MKHHGNIIRFEHDFKIIELVQDLMNGSREVIGYNIIGYGTDGNWLYSLEEAHSKFDDLINSHKR